MGMRRQERLQFAPVKPYDPIRVGGQATTLRALVDEGRIEFVKEKSVWRAARFFARLKEDQTVRWEISCYTYRVYGGK